MPPGRKFGGRKKGTPNKNQDPLKQKAKELGIDPFEILLLFAKGDWQALGYKAETFVKEGSTFVNEELYIKPETRARAAAEACQYIYPKLKAIEHTSDESFSATQIFLNIPPNGKEKKD